MKLIIQPDAGVVPIVQALRRAGLDYHEYARLRVHDSLDAALAAIEALRSGASAAVSLGSSRSLMATCGQVAGAHASGGLP